MGHELMISEKIILSESADTNGPLDELCCNSKYVKGNCKIWNGKKLAEDECWHEIFWVFKQKYIPFKNTSTAGRSWVRVPMRWIFSNLPNPSGHTMALGLTQPLTEISTRNLKKKLGGKM
jgi:hypothetical protein